MVSVTNGDNAIENFELPDEWELQDFPTLEDIPEFSDIEVITEARVTAIFGGKGSGKSALMAWLLEGSRVRHKRNVFYFPADYAFHDGEPLTVGDLSTLNDKFNAAAIGIDEFQQVMSKYRAATYGNRTLASWLQQVRKRGIELIVTSNDPNQIDEALLEQVSLHIWSSLYEDKRCKKYKYHLRDCRDTLSFRIVDTHSRHGKTSLYWDGRRRKTYRLRRAIKLYKLYNTFATVDNLEIAGFDKEKLMEAHEDTKSNMNYDEFVSLMASAVIPNLVDKGITVIYPQAFSKSLAENQDEDGNPDPIIASAGRIGRAMKALGCSAKRGSGGNAWLLPDKDTVNSWAQGMG
jgi:hypothetical protein